MSSLAYRYDSGERGVKTRWLLWSVLFILLRRIPRSLLRG